MASVLAPPPPPRPALRDLAVAFLLLGVTAFGGQAPLLALLNREIAARRGWVNEAQIVEAFTYSKLIPGPVVVQVVAYLGYRIGSGRGAAVASVAFLAPSVAVMLALGAFYSRIATNAGTAAALAGLMAAVVGVVAVGTWAQGRKTITDFSSGAVALIVCAIALFYNPNPAFLVVGAGLIGILRELRKPAEMPEDAP